jgi:drug/metabolite transporter (DMT)-like permease
LVRVSLQLRIGMALAFIYVAWGSTYLAVRIAVDTVSPWTLTAVRMAIVCALMLGVAMLLKQPLPRTRRSWGLVVTTSSLMLVIGSGAVAWAQQWVPSGEAALIMSASALLTPAAAGWSGGTILLRRASTDVGIAMMIGLQNGFAALCFAIYVLVCDTRASTWTPAACMATAHLVVVGSLLGYGAYYWLVSRIQPVVLGSISFVNPGFALLFGILLAGERMSAGQWLGAGLVLGALATILYGSRQRGAQGAEQARRLADADAHGA